MITCTLKSLPVDQKVWAASVAVAENPANAPRMDRVLRLVGQLFGKVRAEQVEDDLLAPQHIAALTTKYWGPKGVDLSVSFMESINEADKGFILGFMNEWTKWCNVRFRWTQGVGEVRVSRQPGGYWSYLGTDIRSIPQGQQTMNLESITASIGQAEGMRVIAHEAGHTCGFPHEHMRPDLVARLDVQKTIVYFGWTQGWSPAEVRQQVLTPITESSLLSPTPVDDSSIMCYQLPGSITVDGKPIPGGSVLSQLDKDYVARIYPKTDQPAPPPDKPPEPPPAVEPQQLFTLTLGRAVPRGGRVSFNSPQALAAGKYGWTKLSAWGVESLPAEETYHAFPESVTCKGETMLQPLVSEFPSEAVSILLPLLRGQLPTNKRLAATAGVNVVSYAVNLGFPEVQLGEAAPFPAMTEFEVSEWLERAQERLAKEHAMGAAIPWKRIVQTLLPLILQWMSGVE